MEACKYCREYHVPHAICDAYIKYLDESEKKIESIHKTITDMDGKRIRNEEGV